MASSSKSSKVSYGPVRRCRGREAPLFVEKEVHNKSAFLKKLKTLAVSNKMRPLCGLLTLIGVSEEDGKTFACARIVANAERSVVEGVRVDIGNHIVSTGNTSFTIVRGREQRIDDHKKFMETIEQALSEETTE